MKQILLKYKISMTFGFFISIVLILGYFNPNEIFNNDKWIGIEAILTTGSLMISSLF